MSAYRISFWHCHRWAWLGYFAKTRTSIRKVSAHEFPRHWRCRKVFHLNKYNQLQRDWEKLLRLALVLRKDPSGASLAERSELRGNAWSAAPTSDLAWLGSVVLLSLGASGLDLCQADSNPWGPDPLPREVHSAARQGARTVPRAVSSGALFPALPSRPTYRAVLTSTCWMWVETVGV